MIFRSPISIGFYAPFFCVNRGSCLMGWFQSLSWASTGQIVSAASVYRSTHGTNPWMRYESLVGDKEEPKVRCKHIYRPIKECTFLCSTVRLCKESSYERYELINTDSFFLLSNLDQIVVYRTCQS